jgi:hypothetical protein
MADAERQSSVECSPSPQIGRGARSPAREIKYPVNRTSRFRRIVFRLASVVLGLLVGLVAIELTMWAAGVEPTRRFAKRYLLDNRSFPPVPYHCYPSNPNGELRPLPDEVGKGWTLFDSHIPKRELPLARLDETPWCMDYRISSQGLRDRVYGPKPPPANGVSCALATRSSSAWECPRS